MPHGSMPAANVSTKRNRRTGFRRAGAGRASCIVLRCMVNLRPEAITDHGDDTEHRWISKRITACIRKRNGSLYYHDKPCHAGETEPQ